MGFHHRGSIRPVPASFQQGQAAMEQLPPTKSELALRLVRRIMADIDADRREWEFSALSPEDQQAERARADGSRRKSGSEKSRS